MAADSSSASVDASRARRCARRCAGRWPRGSASAARTVGGGVQLRRRRRCRRWRRRGGAAAAGSTVHRRRVGAQPAGCGPGAAPRRRLGRPAASTSAASGAGARPVDAGPCSVGTSRPRTCHVDLGQTWVHWHRARLVCTVTRPAATSATCCSDRSTASARPVPAAAGDAAAATSGRACAATARAPPRTCCGLGPPGGPLLGPGRGVRAWPRRVSRVACWASSTASTGVGGRPWSAWKCGRQLGAARRRSRPAGSTTRSSQLARATPTISRTGRLPASARSASRG